MAACAHTPTVGIKGKPLHSQAREIVFNVFTYLKTKDEDACTDPIHRTQVGARTKSDLYEETARATGVSFATVKRIVSEGKDKGEPHIPTDDDGEPAQIPKPIFVTPNRKRKRKCTVTNLDDFELSVARGTISEIHREGNYPTATNVLAKLKDKIGFTGGVTSVREIMKGKLKMRFGKVDNRQFYIERPEIVAHRRRFLRQVRYIRQHEPTRTFIYLDETWLNEHHGKQQQWTHDNNKDLRGRFIPVGKGKRLILLHAGSTDGFVAGCQLLFRSRTKSADYHDEMNGACFEDWFRHQLLPNIPPKSVIIMDNAPYHSVEKDKAPTSATRKGDLIAWLNRKGIPLPEKEKVLRDELYELVKQHKPALKRYVIDEIAAANGHDVIRLPPYHCDFNPIELIWAQVKGEVRKNNVVFKIADTEKLTEDAIQNVTAENWKKAVEHVVKIEQGFWDTDCLIEEQVEPLIIVTGNNDSDSDDDEDTILPLPPTP